MLSPRIRRLKLDHDQMVQKFAGWPLIQITGTAGMPPEVYRFVYNIKGLFVSPTGDIQERAQHYLEVNLSLGYPRRAPQCRMLTPVFHPNIAPHAICIGDHWSAGESLSSLVTRIGEMLAYQSYNTKSPLNGEAARWTDENMDRLPLDAVRMDVEESRTVPAPRPIPAALPLERPAPPPVAQPVAERGPLLAPQTEDPVGNLE